MSLLGSSGGGASTNLAGLSPEQINAISGTDIANSKLGLEQVQNIFENATKMAYADYLDANRKAAKFRTPLVGRENYFDYDPNTGQWVDTRVAVPERLAEHRPSSAFPYWFGPIQTPEGPGTGVGHRGTGTFGPAQTPTGQPAPPMADAARKQTAQNVDIDRKVQDTIALLEGKVLNKQGKPVPYSSADIEFVNKYNTGPMHYFEEVTPTRRGVGAFNWAGEPKKKIMVMPKELFNKLPKEFLNKWSKGKIMQIWEEDKAKEPNLTPDTFIERIQAELDGAK